MRNHLKNELYDVISGKSQVRYGELIQSVTSYLRNGTSSSSKIEGTKQFKEQEAKKLEDYISENKLWITDIDL